MDKQKLEQLKKLANTLTDRELENEYYSAFYEHTGGMVGDRYERGYDTMDVIAQKKREEDFREYMDILKSLCQKRGIKLWETW